MLKQIKENFDKANK